MLLILILLSTQVVVFTDLLLRKAIEVDNFCHRHKPPIAFIKADIRGVFGSVFCDFGPSFTVFDVDGEEPHTGIIASISNDSPALVACVDDERLEFEDGDMVIFSEVQGMSALNDGKPRRVKGTRPYSFFLEEDTTDYGAYEKGGIVTQVRVCTTIQASQRLHFSLCLYPSPLTLHVHCLISLEPAVSKHDRCHFT